MLVASKYEEIWAPEVRDFVYISDRAYTRDQILNMEKIMLNTLRSAIYTQPWVAALPGMMIFITSVSFNLLSDGLRSAMDVKS